MALMGDWFSYRIQSQQSLAKKTKLLHNMIKIYKDTSNNKKVRGEHLPLLNMSKTKYIVNFDLKRFQY